MPEGLGAADATAYRIAVRRWTLAVLASRTPERQENANLCTRIYLVKLLNGVIIGPYTGEQIESGSLQYFEASTDEETTYTIQPDSHRQRSRS